jgi:transcription-repair coupling factor (superfamily II helicase)
MVRVPAFEALADALPAPGAEHHVGGLAGSASSLLVATLALRFPNRLWVLVAADPPAAEAAEADLQALLEPGLTALYPQRETLAYDAAEPHLEISGLRVEALEALLAGRARVLVTTGRALQELAEIPAGLADLRLTLAMGDDAPLHHLAARLDELGFERAPLVDSVGQYAVRGGILDIFGFGVPEPVRVELWGDEVVSIRHFDVLTQLSTRDARQVDILPVDLKGAAPGAAPGPAGDDAAPAAAGGARRSLLDVLPGETVLVQLAAEAAPADLQRAWDQLLHLYDVERRRGGDPEPPEHILQPPELAAARLAAFGRLCVVQHGEAAVRFGVREAEAIDRDMDRLLGVLRAGAARGEDTLILCDNTGQLDRLEEILGGRGGIPPRTTLALGPLAHGFVLEAATPPLRVLTDHEIFKRARRLRRGRRFRGAAALESLAQLRPGDFVVHMDHGVGRFLRMERVAVAGQELEALVLEYAGGEILRVPVYRLDLIERWVPDREEGAPPRLHKIGGKSWRTLRQKTERAIQEMAQELLELYAARQAAQGYAFPQDTRWQKEMESSFLYEDTPDQRQATLDVKRDLETRRPMDRLVCGDVGYGKTEIAIRAAFKVVQEGKQAAVLAPTTILVEQHLHTFRERLAGYPIRIEALSRFRTAKEQQEILAQLAGGQVDIVIGTHRLLEPDIVLRDLGLLVVDEEQRFGVKQKERLKQLKHNVDVLALTATPIPRTLHFSLAGLRDLSLIQTPPRDRMPILTHVLPWVDEVLEDAMRRELDRGGQVFFVHNRVQTIAGIAERVRHLIPDARIDVAHGQMNAGELDAVMRRFIEGEVRILVTTAIIENGLDVASANTMIVDRADQFGLAQLYQLRGRVGRSHHRAYCYLLVPDDASEEAERRLRILEHFTELGSGYAIALKDLELRGAGNILGQEQSGFVHAVGLDTYTRLLEDTIRRIKGQAEAGTHFPPPDVAVGGAAFLPDEYVPESSQKLHLYRRISRLERAGEVTAVRAELRDRFGPPPPEVERLLSATELRLLGAELGVERILLRDDEARVTFRDGVVPRLSALQGAFREHQVEVDVRRAAPLSLVLRRYGAASLDRVLADVLALLARERARAA